MSSHFWEETLVLKILKFFSQSFLFSPRKTREHADEKFSLPLSSFLSRFLIGNTVLVAKKQANKVAHMITRVPCDTL